MISRRNDDKMSVLFNVHDIFKNRIRVLFKILLDKAENF